MIFVRYDPDYGTPFQDGRVFAIADEVVWEQQQKPTEAHSITASTANIFYAFRLLVRRGKLSPGEIEFRYQDKVIYLNEKGMMDHVPHGFLDAETGWLLELF